MSENTTTPGSTVNREQVKEILGNFIESQDDHKVLAVKGKWGVGKTTLVRKFLEEKKQAYCYASVFGLSSIDQLKSQLLSNSITQDEPRGSKKYWQKIKEFINKNFGDGKFSSNSERLSKINSGNLKLDALTVPFTTLSLTLELIRNFQLNNIESIFIIDDIERNTKLNLDELLGFVEYLAQEKKRPVILIYNEESLLEDKEQTKKILEKYREKVIDIEV